MSFDDSIYADNLQVLNDFDFDAQPTYSEVTRSSAIQADKSPLQIQTAKRTAERKRRQALQVAHNSPLKTAKVHEDIILEASY